LVGPVLGLPCCYGYWPALADYHGQTHLLYWHPTTGDIVMQPLDLITAQLTGQPIVIVDSALPISYNTAPIPVTDPNGELIGVSHWLLSGVEFDHYMSFDLDPNTPPVLVNDTTTSTQPSGFVGGRFFGYDEVYLFPAGAELPC
jgi:hypothetical protein